MSQWEKLSRWEKLKTMASSSKAIKQLIAYFLSVEAVSQQFSILLVAYTSVVSHVGGVAVTQTLIDFDDNETESIDNLTDINVRGVSNAVIWSCRDGAEAESYFHVIYTTAFFLLIVLSVISVFINFFRPEFRCKRKVLIYKALIGDSFLCLAILLLFLSFDLSPLSCLSGHSRFEYHILQEIIDLIFKTGVVVTHWAAIITSIICFFVWVITNIICFCVDYKTFEHEDSDRKKMFKDKQYDSDATTEDEDEDRHYEINRVIFK